ncbi:MAG: hypothetical protein ACC656_00010 [Candidatus Heimdallarchaeota archaeon]
MLHSSLKQIKLKDLLSVKTEKGISTVKVIQILTLSNQEENYVINVTSVSVELFKQGIASIEVTGKNGKKWIRYVQILQKAQPSLISFTFDIIKRFIQQFLIIQQINTWKVN